MIPLYNSDVNSECQLFSSVMRSLSHHIIFLSDSFQVPLPAVRLLGKAPFDSHQYRLSRPNSKPHDP